MRRIAHALGFRFRLHRRDLPGRPDLVFPRHRKVVFVHGCFWHRHRCPAGRSSPSVNAPLWRAKFRRNVARDRAALGELRALGWNSLVVWECETRGSDADQLQARIAAFLS